MKRQIKTNSPAITVLMHSYSSDMAEVLREKKIKLIIKSQNQKTIHDKKGIYDMINDIYKVYDT